MYMKTYTINANRLGKKGLLMHISRMNNLTQERDFYIMEYIFLMHRCGFVSAFMKEAELINSALRYSLKFFIS